MKFRLVLIFSCIILSSGLAQRHWKNQLTVPKAFIENKGQYMESAFEDEILFSTHVDGIQVYFTNQGYFYKLTEFVALSEEEIEKMEAGEKNKHKTKSKEEEEMEKKRFRKCNSHFVSVNWKNANPNCRIIASEKQSAYHTFSKLQEPTYAYEKIVYQELYNHIDVEFEFPEGKKGMKYNYILKPGANIAEINLNYANVKAIETDPQGNLVIKTEWGNFTEHEPITFDVEKKQYKVGYIIKDNTVSFHADQNLTKANKNREIKIDPWITVPDVSQSSRMFEIGKDASNNVYVFGETDSVIVQKYNPTGGLLWTYVVGLRSNNAFGDMAVHPNGSLYLCWPTEIIKLNESGINTWTHSDGDPALLTIPSIGENWRCSFNCDYTELRIASGNSKSSFITVKESNNEIGTSPENFPKNGEPRSLSRGLSGKMFGLTTATNQTDPQLFCLDTDLSPLYSVSSRQVLSYATGYNDWGGKNYIASNQDFIYTSDGTKLFKCNIVTGLVVDSAVIADGIYEMNGGMDVDDCGNVFVGGQTAIYQFNSDLDVINQVSTGAPVYDLTIASNGAIYACGENFVGLFDLNNCGVSSCGCLSLSSTNTDCTGGNSGTATINTTGGTGPFTYLWDDGQTTPTAVGLTEGTHLFTVSSATGCTVSGSVNVTSVTSETKVIRNCDYSQLSCLSSSNGEVTVLVNPGSEPYTYEWNTTPIETNDTLLNLDAGIYQVIITDRFGCKDTNSITLLPLGFPYVKYEKGEYCGTSITFKVVGSDTYNYSYLWSDGTDSKWRNFTVPGNYSYSVTDLDSGCLLLTTGTITVDSSFNLYTPWEIDTPYVFRNCDGTTTLEINSNSTDSLEYYITWSTTLTEFYEMYDFQDTQFSDSIINVYMYDKEYCQNLSFDLKVNSNIVQFNGDDQICEGDTAMIVLLNVTNYNWINSPNIIAINSNKIWVNPSVTDTFYIFVNDSLCQDTLSYIVNVWPKPTGIISTANLICSNDSIALFLDSPGNTVVWSGNGQVYNFNPIWVDSAGVFQTSVEDANQCKNAYSIQVTQDSSRYLTAADTICEGDTIPIILTNPGNFSWINSPYLSSLTNDTVFVCPPVTDTFYVALDNGVCKDTLMHIVNVLPKPIGNLISANLTCLTDSVQLFMDSPGNVPVWTGNGQLYTGNPIWVKTPGSYQVTLTATNQCQNSYNVQITLDPSPQSLLIATPESGTSPLEVGFTNLSQYASAYLWDFGNGMTSTDFESQITYLNPGQYQVALIAFNNLGCSDTSYTTIIVYENENCANLVLSVPNIFTPNSDGINDQFIIQFVSDVKFKFSCLILDRWGVPVAEMNESNNTWKGMDQQGKMCSDGVYFYKMMVVCRGKEEVYQGFIHMGR